MTPSAVHLKLARVHVVDGEARVAAQRQRTEKLTRQGQEAAQAIGLLAAMEFSLQLMREHLALEERFADASAW